MTKYSFCHVTHMWRAYENLSYFLIIMQISMAKYPLVYRKWQNILVCHVKYVSRNKWCIPYIPIVTTKFSWKINSLQTVTSHLPFILKYLLLSSGQQLKNQPTTAVAASASAAAEPGSSPWLSPAKWDIVLLWHICAQYYPHISICIAYELL